MSIQSLRASFACFYPPTEADVTDAIGRGVVVFDANCLLHLYRYPIQIREDFLEVLGHIQERIWIPHYCILEFFRNRPSVIRGQQTAVEKVKKALAEGVRAQKDEIAKLNMHARHSLIDVSSLIHDLDAIVTDFHGDLDRKSEQLLTLSNDKVLERIEGLLKDKVGAPPTAEELKAICSDAQMRFELKRPPGFADESKGDDQEPRFVFQGLTYERKFGDFIWWKQLLNYVEANQIKGPVVLVTDDNKVDFWWRVSGATIGPRYELSDEMHMKGVRSFVMIKPERLFEVAAGLFKISVGDNAVETIREITSEEASTLGQSDLLKLALHLMLERGQGVAYKLFGDHKYGADAVVNGKDGTRILVHVNVIRNQLEALQLAKAIPKMLRDFVSGTNCNGAAFFAYGPEIALDKLLEVIPQTNTQTGDGTLYCIANFGTPDTPVFSVIAERPLLAS